MLLIALLPLFLAGCSQQKWWVGKWQVDRQLTERMAKERGELLHLMVDDEMGYEFTGKEMFLLIRGERRESAPYKVLELPTEDSVVLRLEAGHEVRWHREGADLVVDETFAPGKLYFRRVKD